MAKEKPTSLSIYFYHTRLTSESYEEWKQFRFPGHILYGLPLLENYGIRPVMHPYKAFSSRMKLMFYTARKILFCREKFSAVYGTSFRGLELIILLRALGLYRKPVVVWHHTAIRRSSNPLREAFSRLFYRGIDHMFLFSRRLIADSLAARKVSPHKLQLVHWGPDLAFYDHLLDEQTARTRRHGFISTGKERRDIRTLLEAFARTGEELEVYISEECNGIPYRQIADSLRLPANIRIHYTEGVIPYVLARKVAEARFIIICCLDYPYTVGLTTLVEALALGMPVICSRNPYFEMDIDKEEIGITVPYGDTEGWANAVRRLATHPEEAERMGRNARRLAEERFNLEIFSREIAETLLRIG